jgi:hypothetical protein
MRSVTSTSASRFSGDAPAWLRPVYAARQQRTVDLVSRSIAVLTGAGRRISLAAIAATSRQVDPAGKGVSESAVLHNDAARVQYERHRSWRPARRTPGPDRERPAAGGQRPERASPAAKPDRDRARARRRYLRMGKPELVERLLAAEQVYAEARERWLGTNDELLIWMRLVDWLLTGRTAGAGASRPYETPFLAEPNAAED